VVDIRFKNSVIDCGGWDFSERRSYRRRAMVVRFLRAGVAPSKTNTGRIRWKSSLQILRKNPRRWALCSISPFSLRMALINCTSQMEASAARQITFLSTSRRVTIHRSTDGSYRRRVACLSMLRCSHAFRQAPGAARGLAHLWLSRFGQTCLTLLSAQAKAKQVYRR